MKNFFVVFTHVKDGVTIQANIAMNFPEGRSIEKMSEVKAAEKTLLEQGYFSPCIINWKEIIAE